MERYPLQPLPRLSSTLRWATPTRQERPLGRYPDCQHGDGGYPALLPLGSRIDLQANVACSGATTSDVVDSHQLSALNSDTRLVTLTVGAANLDLSDCVDGVYCRTAGPTA